MAKRRRKIKAALAAVLVFGIITIRYRNNLKPAQKESQEVLFTVQPGDTLRSVGSRLEEEGIIISSAGAKSYVTVDENKIRKIALFKINVAEVLKNG